MANTPSDLIQNQLDTPRTKAAPGTAHARSHVMIAEVVPVAGDGAGHLYPLFRVNAHWRAIRLAVQNTADAGLTDCNFSLFAGNAAGSLSAGDWDSADQTVLTGGASILGDAHDLSLASAGPTEILGFGASAHAETLAWKTFWEIAAATEPEVGTFWDIVMESVGDPAGCTVRALLEYTAGD